VVDSQWRASKYVGVTLGDKEYVYSWNGKLIKVMTPDGRTAGIVGNYAEAAWELLNSKMERYSDLAALGIVLHFRNGKWREVASASSDVAPAGGYGDDLKKAKVPVYVINKLKRG
jgi:hypothetical protein